MLKYELTRKELVDHLKSCIENVEDSDKLKSHNCPYTTDQLNAVNDFIEYFVDTLNDPNLMYNTETNFFDYVGSTLPE